MKLRTDVAMMTEVLSNLDGRRSVFIYRESVGLFSPTLTHAGLRVPTHENFGV